MPLNLIKFFTPSYFFNLRPMIDPSTIRFLIIFFGLMVAVGIALKILAQIKKSDHYIEKIFDGYFQLLTIMGVVGIIYVWFRYEQVAILSARFWLFLWLAGSLYWLYRIMTYQLKVVPNARKQAEQKKVFNQYLPKRSR